MKKKVLPYEKMAVFELKNKNLTYEEIANTLGISKRRVSKILFKYYRGIFKTPKQKGRENFRKFLKLSIEGKSSYEIGRITNHARSYIQKILGWRLKSNKKYKINSQIFKEIKSKETAYILGLLYGIGNIYKRKYTTKLSSINIDILEKIKNFINPKIKITKTKRPNKNYYEIFIINKTLFKNLNNSGFNEYKKVNETPPRISDENLIDHFIRGYIESRIEIDTICYQKVITKCRTEKMLNWLLENLEIAPQTIEKRKIIFRLIYRKKDSIYKLHTYLYKNIDNNLYLNRVKVKLEKMLFNMKRKFAKITIEELQKKIERAFSNHEDNDNLKYYDFTDITLTVKKDLSKISFDTENFDNGLYKNGYAPKELVGYHTLDNGLTFLGCVAAGDWQQPVFYMIFSDGQKLRGYIPIKGNNVNIIMKTAYGDHPESDLKDIRERRKIDIDNEEDIEGVELNVQEILEDIYERFEEQKINKKAIH